MPKNVDSGHLDPQQTFEMLRDELKAAQERRNIAFRRYDEAMCAHNAPRNAHSSDGFRRAYFEYNKSQQEVLDALTRLNSYLLNGETPVRLPAASAGSNQKKKMA
jgi:hypothetical protein